MLRESAYEVARPTGVCALTGRAFAPGDPFVAALIESGTDDRLTRRDCDPDAWGAAAAGRLGPGRVIASWRAVMPAPEDRSGRLVNDESLSEIFEQLLEQTGPETPARGAFRFLLALLLVRRRILRHAGTSGNTLLVRWARDADAADAIEVPDPGMDAAALAAATEQLSAVLQSGPPAR